MHQLEFDYLKKNGFIYCNDKGLWESYVIANGNYVHDGFSDKRQLALIQAQFGDVLQKVCNMRIKVNQVNDVEFDVELFWDEEDCVLADSFSSSIGGEGLYELISQAIVLAKVEHI